MARLILGLHDPTGGEVTYGSTPLTELDLGHLRRQCGVVTQDADIFSGSVLTNIALVMPDATLDDVVAAARLAAVHEDITHMPMGYETILGEGGNGLSGGQRQRVALARAVVHRPRVLLLDEATGHLDATTEAIVHENLSELDCTRIVIAHHLSTVRDAGHVAAEVRGGRDRRVVPEDLAELPEDAEARIRSFSGGVGRCRLGGEGGEPWFFPHGVGGGTVGETGPWGVDQQKASHRYGVRGAPMVSRESSGVRLPSPARGAGGMICAKFGEIRLKCVIPSPDWSGQEGMHTGAPCSSPRWNCVHAFRSNRIRLEVLCGDRFTSSCGRDSS
ncbi:ATP-binding cassette domain-containing protein [Streptomyces candidus]|uniref:ABC-type lipoprotein export system ATPase subunit n=1 Tax=Streptomyces candidus TaxID=67283 RepID=A0A7X0LNA5_9ACTN|nr:ATP-binding cassette domain-containing protein [Streptomyces candidus]MBB6435253.1 ABC-type lipoprotein export system ATPase subunit [Streptomyces candidus]GHH40275.1 hypothetical protein GCM10018773_21120 [Streptomyces candidus]